MRFFIFLFINHIHGFSDVKKVKDERPCEGNKKLPDLRKVIEEKELDGYLIPSGKF